MSKVKIKQIKKVVGDADLNNMFEEMMGIKDADADIIVPKFVLVRNTIRHVCKVLTQFSLFKPLRKDFPSIALGLDEIKKFADSVKEDTYLKHDHEENENQYDNVSKEEINNLYRKLKENTALKRLIIMCNTLEKYKLSFHDSTKLKENFVNQEPGLSFKIFDFSSLDLKILWADSKMTTVVKRYILSVFAALYKHTITLYNIITSPDVDIDQFTELLLSSIGELKKQPKLHRCNAAFKRIEQSVELLKGKFSDYYRESLVSRNPDSLVTSFIVDVSNQGGADARLTREFRQIIQYMHEVSQKSGKSQDPQVKKVFDMLNSNFALMEQNSKKKTTDVENSLASVDFSLKTDVVHETVADSTQMDTVDTPLDNENTSSVPESEEKRTKRLEKQKAKKQRKKVKVAASKLVNVVNIKPSIDNENTDVNHEESVEDSIDRMMIELSI
jgi:hypothetical protein